MLFATSLDASPKPAAAPARIVAQSLLNRHWSAMGQYLQARSMAMGSISSPKPTAMDTDLDGTIK